MSFQTLYRVSLYAMLCFATLVLSVDASDSRIAAYFPPLVAVASFVAFMVVDRNHGRGLSGELGGVLALGSVGLFLAEYRLEEQLVLALGHWLVYLQLILMFRDKTVEEDWYLMGLALVQVLVGTVISQSDTLGMILFLWAILALWVLGLFSLRRDAVRASGIGAWRASSLGSSEVYPGLLNVPFLVSGLRVTLVTLALGGAIFLAMPRYAGLRSMQGGSSNAQHLTGFDDEVQLGQLGEILENDTVVMSIELFDEKDNRTSVPGEPLWRGVTMDSYQSGRWHRQKRLDSTGPISSRIPSRMVGPNRVIRQQIKLEANDSNVLFGLRPMIDATTGRRFAVPDLNPLDGSIYLSDLRSGSFDYEVRSYTDQSRPQPGEQTLSGSRLNRLLLMPETLRPRLKEIAERVIEETIAPEGRDDPRAKAKALEDYLCRSGKFGYTLRLDVVDSKIDPVEDFLVNRKEGHCEYFASALALMLRSVGVPSRVVNGFKGGDWNDLAQVLSVRQKHAHSWVEAYMGEVRQGEPMPEWLTLDPTPGNARERSVARVGGFKANFRQISDLIRYIWVFYIVGYNRDRQNRLLYDPLFWLAGEARRGFRMIGTAAANTRDRVWDWLHFPTAREFISWRGLIVSFVGLLLLAAVAHGLVWLGRRLWRQFRGRDIDFGPLSVGAAQYRRLAQLLAEFGLERPPSETQDEFASRAVDFLNTSALAPQGVADVPRAVVDAYYRVRFGKLDLVPAVKQHLDSRLDALESALRSTPT